MNEPNNSARDHQKLVETIIEVGLKAFNQTSCFKVWKAQCNGLAAKYEQKDLSQYFVFAEFIDDYLPITNQICLSLKSICKMIGITVETYY